VILIHNYLIFPWELAFQIVLSLKVHEILD